MKISHLTVAISVALGLTACGGSGSDTTVNNTVPTNPTPTNPTPTNPTTPEEPSDGPDVVKEAERQAPSMTPEARFVPDIKAQKAIYSGRNDRQSIAGYEDYNTSRSLANNDSYQENVSPNTNALIETHYVAGTTKVADILRSGAIYNYVQKGHVVGSGLFNQGSGVASTNPGAVVADPGFTYAQGADGRYYRMQPSNGNWNQVAANTQWVPIDSNNASQFAGGSVGQGALVYIPNARLVDDTLGNSVDTVATVFGDDNTSRSGSVVSRYDYNNTGDPTLDGSNIAGGVDGIRIAGNNDTFTFVLDSFQSNSLGVNAGTSFVTVNAVPVTAGTYQDRRGNRRTNNYAAVGTAVDQFGNPIVTVLANANNTAVPGVAAGINLTAAEAGALISLGQTTATTAPRNFIAQQRIVTATLTNPITTWDEVGGQSVTLSNNEQISQYLDASGNVIYQQTGAANTPGAQLVNVVTGRSYTANDVVRYNNLPALVAVDGTATVGTGAGVAATSPITNAVMANAVATTIAGAPNPNRVQPIITGNGFNIQRGAVQWNYMTMLGKQYTLDSNVTSKTNELDFSSLEVAKKIQEVPVTATFTTLGGKGTTSAGDDKDEVTTVEAGMLKVYNLPYHRSFVNINQDAVDNTGNRGFYDSFNLAGNGVGNGRYGALQVTGVQTQGVPWNGRAEYTGSSYGIYTDGQFVSGDIELAAEFAKDRAQVSGVVNNRKTADGTVVPDMTLERIPLVGSTATQNYDTGTRAMSAANSTLSGAVTIGGVQNAGIWDFQLYGPNAEEIGGLIKYGQNAPVSGQLQPDAPNAWVNPLNAAGNRAGGYNEVFSAQRKDISVTSNQSQLPTK